MVWGCLTGKMGEPGEEGSPEGVEEVAGGRGATKTAMEGTEMGMVREVKERSLPPVGWAGLKESHSF